MFYYLYSVDYSYGIRQLNEIDNRKYLFIIPLKIQFFQYFLSKNYVCHECTHPMFSEVPVFISNTISLKSSIKCFFLILHIVSVLSDTMINWILYFIYIRFCVFDQLSNQKLEIYKWYKNEMNKVLTKITVIIIGRQEADDYICGCVVNSSWDGSNSYSGVILKRTIFLQNIPNLIFIHFINFYFFKNCVSF